jgi:PD-(D/E)XK nuclease superfamily
MSVVFKPENHTYWNTLTGEQYMSVTTFLGLDEPFDKEKAIQNAVQAPTSMYYAWDKAVVEREWEHIREQGTALHKEIERWIKGTPLNAIDARHKAAVEWFSKGAWKGELYSEQLVYSHKLKLAGTLDIISDWKGEDAVEGTRVLCVYDIKTSTSINQKKLEKYSKQIYLYAALLKETRDEEQQHDLTLFEGTSFNVVPEEEEIKVGYIIHYKDYVNNRKEKPLALKPINMALWVQGVYEKANGKSSECTMMSSLFQ